MITQLLPHVLAHGIGGVQDLPVPRWLFFWGGAFVLVVSFIAARGAVEDAAARRHAAAATSARRFGRLVLGPVRIVVQVLSVVLFVVVLAAALFGTTDPFGNLAPTWVYVIFWLGMPLLSLLFGNVWRALSPWRAIADGFVWVWETSSAGRRARSPPIPRASAATRAASRSSRSSRSSSPTRTRRTRGPSRSRSRSTRTSRSSGCSRSGARPGRARARDSRSCSPTSRGWRRFVARDGRIRLRVPLTGLAGAEHVPGSVLFLAVALGSVGFDGFSRTITWQNLIARVEAPYILNEPGTGELLVTGLNLLGLVAAIAIVLAAFLGACAVARTMVKAPRSLAPEFVLSLVPIALVYAVAHYFSLFVIQGQYMVPLLSDPFGKGWDLFGTAGFHPNIALLTPNTIWYVQVGALVLGPRGRPRRRARPGGDDLPRPPGCAPQPVRDARADGALHGRRALAALARMTCSRTAARRA